MNKFSKGFAHIFLLLVIVLIGIGGLFYYSWQKGLIKTTPSQNISLTPTPHETASQAPNGNLTNWKTYTDEVCSYTIRHPSNWNATKDQNSGVDNLSLITSPDFKGNFVIPSKIIEKGDGIAIWCQPYVSEPSAKVLNQPIGSGEGLYVSKLTKKIYRIDTSRFTDDIRKILNSFSFLNAEEKASGIIIGSIYIYRPEETYVTVELRAVSTSSEIVEMRIWADKDPVGKWQNYSEFVNIPNFEDIVYAQFRDKLGNVSGIYLDHLNPPVGPPDAPVNEY